MTKTEFQEIFQITKIESRLHLPNVIFTDLQEALKDKDCNHLAFAYCYVYWITWMWRFTKYGIIDTINPATGKTSHMPLKPLAKRVMGLSENCKTYDYIIRKGGVLQKLGYTEQVKYAPIALREGFEKDMLTDIDNAYVYENECDDPINRKSNKPDRPVRGYHSSQESVEEEIFDGTFYESRNSHNVPVEAFVKCITNENLGTIAFYLYGFLCHRTDIYKQGFNASREALESMTGLSKTKLNEMLLALEEEGMITVRHAKFIVDKPAHIKTPANTYWAKRGGWEKMEVKENKPVTFEQYIAMGGTILNPIDGEFKKRWKESAEMEAHLPF